MIEVSPQSIKAKGAEFFTNPAAPVNNFRPRVTLEAIAGAAAAAIQATVVQPLGMSLGDFMSMDIPPRIEVIRGVGRGENAMIVGTTNGGKTSLLKNVALSLACGRPFLPLVEAGPPRRVAYFDFESTQSLSQSDFRVMLRELTPLESKLVKENLFFYCGVLIDRIPLKLSNPVHYARVTEDLSELAPDLIIVDTVSRAFSIVNENDNSEIIERVMIPMNQLAIIADAGLIGSHHIGKAKAEEGASRDPAHRGRGASSFADQSIAIFSLEKDNINETVTLSCSKIKGPRFDDHVLRLDAETRWFGSQERTEKLVSSYELVVGLFSEHELSTNEAIEALKGRVRERSVKANLTKAVRAGDLHKLKHGLYGKPNVLQLQNESAIVRVV